MNRRDFFRSLAGVAATAAAPAAAKHLLGLDPRQLGTPLPGWNLRAVQVGRIGSRTPNIQRIPIRTDEGRSIRKLLWPTLYATPLERVPKALAQVPSGEAARARIRSAFAGSHDVWANAEKRIRAAITDEHKEQP